MNLFAIHFLNTRNLLNHPPDTYRSNTYSLNPIPVKNGYAWKPSNHLPNKFWGVCNTPLPWRIKKSILFYLLNQKPGTFGVAGLHGLSIPGEKPLKFVWTRPKPAEDSMNMAISTQNPPGIGRIWPYSRKTRRGFDEYGHIHAKPAGDGTNMAISAQNPPGIWWI